MLIIGLTGGIGSGKSTVADYFANLDIPVLDADRFARDLVVPGSQAMREIAGVFGSDVLLADGGLNRALLRERIFADPEQRRRLEAILHPRIYAEMRRRIGALHAAYCILVIPLLLETGAISLVDRVLVVDAPESLQRQRASARDGMRADLLEAILRSQLSRAERLDAADDIIVNDADLSHLRRQAAALHRHYLDLAAAAPSAPKTD